MTSCFSGPHINLYWGSESFENIDWAHWINCRLDRISVAGASYLTMQNGPFKALELQSRLHALGLILILLIGRVVNLILKMIYRTHSVRALVR